MLVSLLQATQTSQATQLSLTFKGPSLVLCRIHHYQLRATELPLAQVSCFCITIVGLIPSLILLILPLLDFYQKPGPSAYLWISTSASISCWMKVL